MKKNKNTCGSCDSFKNEDAFGIGVCWITGRCKTCADFSCKKHKDTIVKKYLTKIKINTK